MVNKGGWHTIGGKKNYYRSSWEVIYAKYLEFLKKNRQIKEWQYEVKTFWFEKIKRGTRSYLPDFQIEENNGEIVYHEVKGWMNARSKTKIKRMAKYYPDVKLRIIDGKWFKENGKKIQGLI